MRIQTIARYASGKSPVMGIPVFSIAEGGYITAVFRRGHVQAALEAGACKAHYDEREHVLELNGTKRVCYRLKNLCPLGHGVANRGPLSDELRAWADSRRKSARTRGLPVAERRRVKLLEEIGKLERKQAKISPHLPFSPLLGHRYVASEEARRMESLWHGEKDLRRALGRLVQQGRKTWAQFYRDVEKLIGRSVSSGSHHDRVCNRKGGPDRIEYLEQLYRHVGMTRKPLHDKWEPYKELNRFQIHRLEQMNYLMLRNEQTNLQVRIEACREEIEALRDAGMGGRGS